MSTQNTLALDKLFGSKTRAKLLALFFGDTEKSYYVREITRVIEEQINSVRRELTNLNALGLIGVETYENKVYYTANKKHPLTRAMTEIFSQKISSVRDMDILAASWAEYIRPVKNILKALVFTNRKPGEEGIDLLIIGNDRGKKLTRWAEAVEKKQGKPLNYVIMTREDYTYRKSVRDKFIADIFALDISERIDPENIL